MGSNCTFNLDWLGFTFKPTPETFEDYDLYCCGSSGEGLLGAFYKVFPEIYQFYMTCEFQQTASIRPGNHYQLSIDCCDYFWISYDDNNSAIDKGVNVQVPSHGLAKFFELLGIVKDDPKKDLYDMLHLLYDRCCFLSRIDLCLDDFDKTFRPHDYEKWFVQGIISHKFSARAFFTAASGAETIYFGKMRSDKFLRIYDKFIESKGEVDSVRYEFELHGRPCKELALFLLENEFDFGKYLLSWFKVHDPQRLYDKTNLSKSPLLPEWEAWLNLKFNEVPTPIIVPHKPRVSDIEGLIQWKKSCNWALFTAMTLSGSDPLSVMEALGLKPDDIIKTKIPIKYRRILEDHRIL